MTLAKSLQTQEVRLDKVVASGPAGAEDKAADSKAVEACGCRADRDLHAAAAGDKASAAAMPTRAWKTCLS